MRAFAALLDRLSFTPQRNGKLRLIADYLGEVGDPDRGYALAALTGDLSFRQVKAGDLREMIEEVVDPLLFRLSYDFVGDLAETVALLLPEPARVVEPPRLAEVVEALAAAKRGQGKRLIAPWLARSSVDERWALLKLVTGGLRVGVSARLAKTALAQRFEVPLTEIEEIWHGLELPYRPLFDWLEGRRPRPEIGRLATFRPLMLANPLEERDLASLAPEDYTAEWKWDGIRVQLAAAPEGGRLFSRAGEEIGGAFPEILEAASFDAVLDGELLVARDGEVAPFNDLQQRLNRKSVTGKLLASHPAHLRLYDLLFEAGEDLRLLPFVERRARLEAWHGRLAPARMDLSPLVPFAAWEDLAALREEARRRGIEGLMLKRRDSPYLAGRPKGPWFKWKRDPLTLDTVLMYAQRGHGKRSSLYSDFTFGVWRATEDGAGEELVPIGKAYFGFTDAELAQLDRFVRQNTVERYGPVRALRPGLVLEVAFDAVQRSARHRSGLALRFPRIARIRWDKPVEEAERLDSVLALVED